MSEKQKLYILLDWATSGDTGTSSEFLCRYLLGFDANKQWEYSAPSDSGDRGRCIRLLDKMPEWWKRLDELSGVSEDWEKQIPLIKAERNKHS